MKGYFFTAATEDTLDLALELWYELPPLGLQDALDTAVDVAPGLLDFAACWDFDAECQRLAAGVARGHDEHGRRARGAVREVREEQVVDRRVRQQDAELAEPERRRTGGHAARHRRTAAHREQHDRPCGRGEQAERVLGLAVEAGANDSRRHEPTVAHIVLRHKR